MCSGFKKILADYEGQAEFDESKMPAIDAANDDKKPASEKFWELEKRIKEDKRHPGVIMEMSKSEVIWDIVRLIRLKVITYDDLSDFSDGLQLEVKRILEMSR